MSTPIDARRPRSERAFDAARQPHPGLLLARGLRAQDDNTAKAELAGRVAGISAGSLYASAFARWRDALAHRPGTCMREMAAPGSLIVGLGGASVLETAITLQHCYGTPLIPGSALKGLARHFAQQALTGEGSAELGPGGEYHRILFGSTESAAFLTYYDAWYVPGSAPQDRPLVQDVITVHHPRYYTGSKRRPPWDFDDPNPVTFLSARGRYLVAVGGPDAGWSQFALALLTRALAEYGAGGKTAAGYGRLQPVG